LLLTEVVSSFHLVSLAHKHIASVSPAECCHITAFCLVRRIGNITVYFWIRHTCFYILHSSKTEYLKSDWFFVI